MKIICTQENLTRGLQLVSHIASKNVSLPVLNNVLIRAEKGELTLQTTNLEIGIVCSVRGKVEEEGAISVQAKTLNDYVNLLPKENITLKTTEDVLRVDCGTSHTTLKGVDATEFPLIPEVDAAQSIRVDAGELRSGLSSVVFAVAFDDTRPEISGINLIIEKEGLIFAATDSYRLAESRHVLSKEPSSETMFILPARAATELTRILADVTDEVEIKFNENQVLFQLGEARLTSRLVEGKYPDYKQIIPKEHTTQATLNTQDFINTVKRASLFCKPGANDVVLNVDADKGEVVVSAANVQIGESEARQSAAIEGESNSIVFNYRFFLDGLQNINEEECVLELNTNTTPGLLRPQKSRDYTYIIMPIKQ